VIKESLYLGERENRILNKTPFRAKKKKVLLLLGRKSSKTSREDIRDVRYHPKSLVGKRRDKAINPT